MNKFIDTVFKFIFKRSIQKEIEAVEKAVALKTKLCDEVLNMTALCKHQKWTMMERERAWSAIHQGFCLRDLPDTIYEYVIGFEQGIWETMWQDDFDTYQLQDGKWIRQENVTQWQKVTQTALVWEGTNKVWNAWTIPLEVGSKSVTVKIDSIEIADSSNQDIQALRENLKQWTRFLLDEINNIADTTHIEGDTLPVAGNLPLHVINQLELMTSDDA